MTIIFQKDFDTIRAEQMHFKSTPKAIFILRFYHQSRMVYWDQNQIVNKPYSQNISLYSIVLPVLKIHNAGITVIDSFPMTCC